ncbi:MAG: hypothetical protein A2150_00500 [Candidatus Muproteobacteria bacterium RBG_16_64_11]|uniref:Uncharacterized protein n=1 Tax=Candidatus Muproteobacteria bacterium RBG_16_64_11 TaxID=1817758 RepID=A0A1F6T9S7_9PROT|nr:MAG: hypothetical protein A2150_00500 [Candidatus Muproteobacteria bacterium RBG_16_64_11]
MTAETAETKTFRLSHRLSVELSVSRIGLSAEWSPDLPVNGLTPGELRRYREARREMLERLAQKLGGAVIVVEG